MQTVDSYLEKVIKVGDEGSELLAKLCSPTLKNCEHIRILSEGMQARVGLKIPKGYMAVVHSASGGNMDEQPGEHAYSMVQFLVGRARAFSAKPLAFANVIDSRTGDTQLLRKIAEGLVDGANKYHLAIMNGENAILGERLNADANVSGTLISMKKLCKDVMLPSTFMLNGVHYTIFNPNIKKGSLLYMNSDGVGTKTELYERAQKFEPAVEDWIAMDADDAAKINAVIQVLSGVIETRGNIPVDKIIKHAKAVAKRCGFEAILQPEDLGNRLNTYNPNVDFAFSISGSAVSVVSESGLKNPPKPKEGDYVIAIKAKGPRSNGITDKRKAMVKLYDINWHEKPEGKEYLDFLASPSTIFYPLFKELLDNKLATCVYHMSGGAYNGKLARPLAKENLFVSLDNLFEPDPRELSLAEQVGSIETAYAKWPMGNEGFITTTKPIQTMDIIKEKYGLECRVVGSVEKAVEGKTGVEIKINGKTIYFSGN